MSLIELKKITRHYIDGHSTVEALRGIDLNIEDGEFTALAGPSGSGKTTLLNIISGLDEATSGEAVFDGVNLGKLKPTALSELRLHKIGFVFQAYNLIPVLTARENVEFTMMLQGIGEAERKQRAEEILERVGLADQSHRRPAALSGGQQQRVAVCRAIVTHPRVVLADEPTANLDSGTGRDLLDLMRELNRDEGITFIFSTHDDMVMDRSSRIIRLHDGRIESDETKN